MKRYASEDIRNIALIGHGTSGKTTLAEAMLHVTGKSGRMGSVDDGSTAFDYLEEEIEKRFTVSMAVGFVEHKGKKINVLDTPGFADFVGEVAAALRVVDAAVVVVHASGGIEVGTERGWRQAQERGLPRFLFVNQMDRENVDFDSVLSSLRERWGNGVAPYSLPIGSGEEFRGVVDVLGGKAYLTGGKADGVIEEAEVPAEIDAAFQSASEALMEAAAESDDALLEKYFEQGALSRDDMVQGLRAGVAAGKVYPVFCGCAVSNIGVRRLLDAVADLCPSSLDAGTYRVLDSEGEELDEGIDPGGAGVALVFKTQVEKHVGELAFVRMFSGKISAGDDVRNLNRSENERLGHISALQAKDKVEVGEAVAGDIVALVKLKHTHTGDTLAGQAGGKIVVPPAFPAPLLANAIRAKSKADEDKIGAALARLRQEDPTVHVRADPELKQTVISGMGEVHLDLLTKRLQARYGVEVEISEPRIGFRETIKGKAEAHYRHKKQSGGRGQFADVHIRLEAGPRGSGYEFVNAIVGGVVPGKFIPAVNKGVQELLPEGVLAGYPIVDLKVTLHDGGFHAVDSSEMAFKIAARQAMRRAFMEAKPVLLEPILNIAVTIPESFMGSVMGDLTSRRGRTQGMDPDGAFTTIRAEVPEAEMYRYSTHLRSMTGGRGAYTSTFSHHEEVPGDIAPKVIEAAKAAKADSE